MNRIDRLHAILTHLQSKKKVTAQEIADRFNISLRTVYRDVKALDESGVPVIGEAGMGYTIMEGYRLPPVMFTQEEASALILGSKLAEQFTDGSVRKHYETALFKIKSVLRSADKDHLDELDGQIAVTPNRNAPVEENSDRHLVTIQKALSERKVLRLVYYSVYNEATTERTVEPIGLYYYGQTWHLIAWCQLRGDYRDFRVSRIKNLQTTDISFAHKQHRSLQEYINTMMSQQTDLKEVAVDFEKSVAKFVGEQRYFYGFLREERGEQFTRLIFLVSNLEYFGRWLLMYTTYVHVVTPELQVVMEGLVSRVSGHYRGS